MCNQLIQTNWTACLCVLLSRLQAIIVVQNVYGGKWEFPLTLIASEPQVDDVIVIEATGLGETAAVGFRLTSTTRCVWVVILSINVLLAVDYAT